MMTFPGAKRGCRALPVSAVLLIFLFPAHRGMAQTSSPKKTDTDTLKLYSDIKKIAHKRKVTEWLYKFVFADPPQQPNPVKAGRNAKQKKPVNTYAKYEGRIIRNVQVQTLDPFGTKVNDTIVAPLSGFEKIANKVHLKSRKITVRNQLLFKKGDVLDALKLKESERILRQSAYVRDARVSLLPLEGKSDSVDVLVVVQDIWSIGGSASASSTSKGTVNGYEKNFLGLGHQIDNTFYYYPGESIIDYSLNYLVPYIRNTFITGRGFYNKIGVNTTTGISLNRDFYSPLTKWAGGIDLVRSNTRADVPITYYQQDYWLGRSFRVLKGSSDRDRSSRIILSGRIYNLKYTSKPIGEADSISPYLNSTSVLGSIGFSQRTYYKDNYIYRYGSMEDVPEGRLISLTGGVENRTNLTYYTGIKAVFARHFDNFGYLASSWDYGAYNYGGHLERGLISAGVNYFSDLLDIGKLRIRQFINANVTHGIRRTPNEVLNLSSNGIYGFSNTGITGTDRITLNLQSVVYTPYTLLGFHFAPVIFGGVGLVGSSENPILNTKVYQVYGLGVLIKNENLVISTIQISVGYYPVGEGSPFKLNPTSVYDLRFRDLFISKPSTVPFQ